MESHRRASARGPAAGSCGFSGICRCADRHVPRGAESRGGVERARRGDANAGGALEPRSGGVFGERTEKKRGCFFSRR
jgi:hypothetical protein